MPVVDTISPIKLNLGCGNKILNGYINCDLADNPFKSNPDVACDITRELPFPDDYADEILAVHVIEHFYTWDIVDILKEWNRVLKPGGVLAVECPDLNKVLRMLLEGEEGPSKTFLALYGAQDSKDPHMVHKWCYTWTMLKEVLEMAGFKNMIETRCQWHIPRRDIRVECTK